MQRKGNAIRSESQVKNQISVGIDMGGSLWATAVQDWEAGNLMQNSLPVCIPRIIYQQFTSRPWKRKVVGMRNGNGIASKRQ